VSTLERAADTLKGDTKLVLRMTEGGSRRYPRWGRSVSTLERAADTLKGDTKLVLRMTEGGSRRYPRWGRSVSTLERAADTLKGEPQTLPAVPGLACRRVITATPAGCHGVNSATTLIPA
jgi:hypothetical protein